MNLQRKLLSRLLLVGALLVASSPAWAKEHRESATLKSGVKRTKVFEDAVHIATELEYPTTGTKVTYKLGSHSSMLVPSGGVAKTAAQQRFYSPLFSGPTLRLVETRNRDGSVTERANVLESQTGIHRGGREIAGGYRHLSRWQFSTVSYPSGALVSYHPEAGDDHIRAIEVNALGGRDGDKLGVRPRISVARCQAECGPKHLRGRAREANRRAIQRRPARN